MRILKSLFLLGWTVGACLGPSFAQNALPSLAPKSQPVNPGQSSAAQVRPRGATPFEFFDGDRVVLLGDTLIEREQSYGYVETRLLARHPNRRIHFRNLGWSADTPVGQSRVSFDWNKPEEEWFKPLLAQVAAVRPTVVILGYGMAASFDRAPGLPKFKTDLTRLISAIQALSKEKPIRFILLSPIRHEHLPPPLPDPTAHNEMLARYETKYPALRLGA